MPEGTDEQLYTHSMTATHYRGGDCIIGIYLQTMLKTSKHGRPEKWELNQYTQMVYNSVYAVVTSNQHTYELTEP